MYRFHDVASIWVERNILLMNSYWPRRAYLEIIGFQDSEEHPGQMRVAAAEERPSLQVRALEWVIADSLADGGWRPLRLGAIWANSFSPTTWRPCSSRTIGPTGKSSSTS